MMLDKKFNHSLNTTTKKQYRRFNTADIEKKRGLKKMIDKILIYSHNKILIVSSADNVDLLGEYISLICDVPFPKCGFSNRINKSDILPYGMVFSKNRFYGCKRFITHPLAKREYRKLITFDFNSAMVALDEIINKQSI